MTAWYERHGEVTRQLLAANQRLTAVTGEWQTSPADTLRDRTTHAALGLLEAVRRHQSALPMGVQFIDGPLREGLEDLHRGAGLLAFCRRTPRLAGPRCVARLTVVRTKLAMCRGRQLARAGHRRPAV